MISKEPFAYGRSITARAVAFAIVAMLGFSAGIALSGNNSASAIVARIPLIGDGLDATPDTEAELADFWKAWNALEDKYVSTHASSTMPSARDRIFGAIQGLAASYGDPYTVFMPPTEAKIFTENISGHFAGVGMEIGIKNDLLTVIAPLKGTPAEAAGIRAGDQIVAIDSAATDDLSIDKAVSLIRGPAGSQVRLTLIREGKPLEVTVTRETIQVPKSEDSMDSENGVYKIALYEFTSDSASVFSQTLARFKASGSRRLILDLRGNPGGYLDAAVDIAGHFLPEGAKIVTEDFGGKEPNRTHTSYGYDDLPAGTKTVVLVDGGSASASEILAGALQDNNVATVIGMKTFGKGSVQTLIDLDGGALKVTVARWITPAGNWIMGNGISPDIAVPFTQADADAKKDPQMERAVRFLTTGM
ncbi:S41 family peptidase [Candidatus Kaiserbacteria bacterium]|nr:S41 family peptidase [Candidatus Kaiserbacteria bacterium]